MPILQRKILTVVLMVLLVGLGYKILQVRSQRTGIDAQVNDLKSRVADLESNNNFLASSSAYFASDVYLERQARLKLNFQMSRSLLSIKIPVLKPVLHLKDFRKSYQKCQIGKNGGIICWGIKRN